MNSQKHFRRRLSAGFTLLELLVVMLILGIVIGAVFTQMDAAQQRMSTEEIKLDDFQQARDFVDQFFRDINQIGDPNFRLMDTNSGLWIPALVQQSGCPSSCTYSYASPYINDNRFAIGLVRIDSNELRFEATTNGVGTVQSIIYMINATCPRCLQRSQVDKVAGDPLNGQNTPNWGSEVNDVIRTPIFRYFLYNGTEITSSSTPCGLPVDYTISAACAQTLASIKTIQINLRMQNPNVLDPKTHVPIETSFEGEVSLNNCSMAASTYPMSCQ